MEALALNKKKEEEEEYNGSTLRERWRAIWRPLHAPQLL
jgi:hypothetical protein